MATAADVFPECPRLDKSCPLRLFGWRCLSFEDAMTCDEENGEEEKP